MNTVLANWVGGLTGAVALNLIHQAVKLVDADAPRVDLLGEEAFSKGLVGVGIDPPKGKRLFAATLAGDIVSNAAYYSTIGIGKDQNLLARGATLGVLAGLGAVALPKRMGLNDAPVTRTRKTTFLTVSWYVIGGLVAASAIRPLRRRH